MDVYLARQPIFKKNKKIYGYELLFRDGISNFFPEIDGETATSKVLSNAFLCIGIEKITAGVPAFINFPESLIVKKVPTFISPRNLVVEILEDVDPRPDVVTACEELLQGGYPLALDDFCFRPEYEKLISLAKIIKLDIRAMPWNEVRETVQKLRGYSASLLAEKVETYEDFRNAFEMGFSYFQGYFFSKPEVLTGKDISVPKMTLVLIMAEANKDDFDFGKLEKIIERDVGISYKLLRYINSAYFGVRNKVSSIKQAIVLLGERQIRQFLSLVAMSNLAAEKPSELIRSSVIRAKFCELAGAQNRNRINPAELFTLGLFSYIDAILDESMVTLMKRLPLSEEIKKALIGRDGVMGDYLQLASFYEKGDWENAALAASRLGLKEETLPKCFMESLNWANAFSQL